jgi:hypothetical protein
MTETKIHSSSMIKELEEKYLYLIGKKEFSGSVVA